MVRKALRLCGIFQNLICRKTIGRNNFADAEHTFRECAGLVKHNRVNTVQCFEVIPALHKDAVTGCRADPTKKRQRNGNHKCARAGDDKEGQACIDVAKKENINGCFCKKQGARTTFAFILTDKQGENQVTEYKGAELTVEDVLNFENEIATCDYLLLQHEVPCDVNEMAVKLAKKHGVKVILNPAPVRTISDKIAEMVYVVTPNEQEKQAIDAQRFKNNITTLGKKGCLINEDTFIPAIEVRTVDTTGAGDTFNGVLAVCLAEGLDMTEACKYAVTASGISVGRRYVLNAIPCREEIERKIKDDE